MRFNTPVYFRRVTPGEYIAATGNYADDVITEVKRYADVTDVGDETLRLIYSELKQGCKVVRLLRPYKEPFSDIRIGDKVYTVDRSKRPTNKQVFVVSEVQG